MTVPRVKPTASPSVENPSPPSDHNRRSFLKTAGTATATVAVSQAMVGPVHAGEDNTIRLALIGCGNRGSGAVLNAFNTSNQGPIKLHAIADLDPKRIELAESSLARRAPEQVDVPQERRFIGFEAYKDAIDILRPGDIAMCTTRAYIRPIHVEYAVSKGIHVFMEKPFACDPVGLHRMRAAGRAAEKTGSKISAGLQCRHSPARAALIERIRDGVLGELSYVRASRMGGRRWMGSMGERANIVAEQLKFGRTGLLWIGSGHMVDNLIHQIDECCWLMNDWPVECHGMGGREVGSTDHGQNLDTYSMEFTFSSGRKAFCGFRRAKEGHVDFATFVHGSKKAAQFSGNIHKAVVHMYEDQRIDKNRIEWSPEPDAKNPWDYEWDHFIHAIRNDLPYNECERAVMADYASLLGRAATHQNTIVTMDEIMNSKFQFCNYLDELNEESVPPELATADEEGYFPAPHAGKWSEV